MHDFNIIVPSIRSIFRNDDIIIVIIFTFYIRARETFLSVAVGNV